MESANRNSVLFLTEAVQTSAHLNLHEGYFLDASECEDGKMQIIVAVTRKRILRTFWNLTRCVGKRIVPRMYCLPLTQNPTPRDVDIYTGEATEKVIAQSGCADFYDVLLKDGRMMFEIDNVRSSISLQLAPEKLIVVTAVLEAVPRFERMLCALGIPEHDVLETIADHGYEYALVAAPEIVERRDQMIHSLGLELQPKDL